MMSIRQIKIEVLCAAESPPAQEADTQRFRRAIENAIQLQIKLAS